MSHATNSNALSVFKIAKPIIKKLLLSLIAKNPNNSKALLGLNL